MMKIKKDMTGWKMWEHGVFNSQLTVIEQAEDVVYNNGKHYSAWLCQCSCGSPPFSVRGDYLKSGHTCSCGCLLRKKSLNQYDLTGEYGVGFSTNTNEKFYFDLEDYDLIRQYTWHVLDKTKSHRKKSLCTVIQGKKISFHNLLGFKNYDHINRNELDNRKSNLRLATNIQNSQNKSLGSNNTSGVIGVIWREKRKKWRAYIGVDKKRIELGEFKDKEEAIKTRLQAEAVYFKEFAPQQHLFNKYGVSIDKELKNDNN